VLRKRGEALDPFLVAIGRLKAAGITALKGRKAERTGPFKSRSSYGIHFSDKFSSLFAEPGERNSRLNDLAPLLRDVKLTYMARSQRGVTYRGVESNAMSPLNCDI
jgi:hypothetical protein